MYKAYYKLYMVTFKVLKTLNISDESYKLTHNSNRSSSVTTKVKGVSSYKRPLGLQKNHAIGRDRRGINLDPKNSGYKIDRASNNWAKQTFRNM